MTATILRADTRTLPLPDESVDLIVTSPPYFALRDYRDGGSSLAGQIGAESAPQEYIASLIECTREWVRVLKPSGSILVNLGDKYSGHQGAQGTTGQRADRAQAATYQRVPAVLGIRPKSLLLLPERYRIAAVDQLGLIARAVLIWDKPNGMPESCTDRVRRSHEDWVHLTKAPWYYSAVDEIREAHTESAGRPAYGRQRVAIPGGNRGRNVDRLPHAETRDMGQHALGRLPGSVWEIATEPLRVPDHLGISHFAAFPVEWPRRLILGWSPSGICVECGEGRRLVVDRGRVADRAGRVQGRHVDALLDGHGADGRAGSRFTAAVSVVGQECSCPEPTAPTRPAVVLDPFSGTGTTALVASALGRHGIGVDRSADYCRLARWRTTDPGQIAKAMRVAPSPKESNGQGDLLDLLDEAVAS